jgi:hypothetical protein
VRGVQPGHALLRGDRRSEQEKPSNDKKQTEERPSQQHGLGDIDDFMVLGDIAVCHGDDDEHNEYPCCWSQTQRS